MSAGLSLSVPKYVSMPSSDELHRIVDSKTYRQIRELRVNCRGLYVRITGSSSTYYIKQLATQAVFDLLPAARLENRILVGSD